MHDILVVVLSYKKIREVIRAVQELSSGDDSYGLRLHFLVVDNSEGKELLANVPHFRICQGDEVLLIPGENRGFSRSVNYAVQYAKQSNIQFDYIFLLNDDAYGSRKELYKLVQALATNKFAAVAGPTILYKDLKRIWSSGAWFSYVTSSVRIPFKRKFVDEVLTPGFAQYHEVDFVSGCAMLIKREIWDRIGPLDEEIFFYEEDLEYCMRVKRNNYKVIYVADSIFIHDISDDSDRLTEFVLRSRSESFLISRKKFLSKIWYIYSVLIFLFLHTPYKIYQIFSSPGGSLKQRLILVRSWLSGFASALIRKDVKGFGKRLRYDVSRWDS